jgi:hypothetical protein
MMEMPNVRVNGEQHGHALRMLSKRFQATTDTPPSDDLIVQTVVIFSIINIA